MKIETMRIKSTHPQSQGDFVEINKADFDPKTMIEYVENQPEPKPKVPRAK